MNKAEKTPAPCRNEDPELFFPHPSDVQQTEKAKAVCRGCSIAQKCLQFALDNNMQGVWGGMGEKERRSRVTQRVRDRRTISAGPTELRDIVPDQY